MKIIHCADIHLDSKMETHMTRQQAAERGRELLQTFLGLIDYAADNGVRAVVIAGDLFDSARISAVTAGSVLDAMADHPDIDFTTSGATTMKASGPSPDGSCRKI